MTKFEQALKKYNEAQEKKSGRQKELSDLEGRREELEKKALAAAEEGKDEEYLRMKAEAERTEALIFVRKTSMKNMDKPITEAEARAAWEEYVSTADKEFRKKYADYKKAREKLFQMFLDIVEMQKTSFRKRQLLAEWTDTKIDSYKLETLDSGETRGDLDYYFRGINRIGLDEARALSTIINTRRV